MGHPSRPARESTLRRQRGAGPWPRGGPPRPAVRGLRLNPEQELVIFGVAQEALHNIEHHARASPVVVHLAYDPGPLCVEVVDDGCGFDPAQVRQNSLGLAGMQERASLIGAAFEVLSRPGVTTLRLDLPPVSNPTTAELVRDAPNLLYH